MATVTLALLMATGVLASAAGQGPVATTIHGQIQDQAGEPLTGVVVLLAKTSAAAVSDDQGHFDLMVPAGTGAPFVITATLPGYVTRSVTLPSAALTEPVRLSPVRPTFSAVTRASDGSASAPANLLPPLDGRLVLRPLDVVRTAGTEADLMRAIGLTPGVVSVDAGDGLFVRGGDVSETQVLLDGVVVNHPYRDETPTGGFRGAVDPFMTQDTAFTTGGFGSPYGDVLSAVVDLHGQDRPLAPQRSVSAGLAGVSFSDAQPLGETSGFRVSANRATPSLLFAVNPSSSTFDQLPGGWDLSGAFYAGSPRLGAFKVFALAQADHVGVELREEAFTGFLHSSTQQALVMATWQRALPAGWEATAAVGFDAFGSTETAGVMSLVDDDHAQSGRFEVHGVARGWTLRVGGTFQIDTPNDVGRVPTIGGDFGGISGVKSFEVDTRTWTAGPYAEAERALGLVTIEAGVRTDYFAHAGATTIDPRLAVLVALPGSGRIRVAWGDYHQAPASAYLDAVTGQPRLGPMEATQYIVGYEVGTLSGPSFFRLEAYDKRYAHLPLADAATGFSTAGYGSAKGVDLFVRHVWSHLALRGNASWLEARRRWTPWNEVNTYPTPVTGTWPPDFDIPYAFDAVATILLTPRWSIDATWRTTDGRPFTPVVGAVPTAGGFLPLWGPINSGRVPPYARLDASINRRLAIGKAQAVLFLSGGNLLDRHNFYEYSYSPDYTARTPVPTGSPRNVYVGVTLTR